MSISSGSEGIRGAGGSEDFSSSAFVLETMARSTISQSHREHKLKDDAHNHRRSRGKQDLSLFSNISFVFILFTKTLDDYLNLFFFEQRVLKL